MDLDLKHTHFSKLYDFHERELNRPTQNVTSTRLHPQGRVAPKGLFVRYFLGHLDNDHLRKMKKT